MQETALVRLPLLEPISRDLVPSVGRLAIRERDSRKQAARGRVISGAVMTALSGLFALAYGIGAVLAWTNGGHMVFRLVFSIFSAGLLVASRYILGQALSAADEYRALAPPPSLLKEAALERTLDEAAAALNAKAADWNEAAYLAERHGVEEIYVIRLRASRATLERRRERIMAALRRAVPSLPTGPVPRALPPAPDWGHVEPVDLEPRTDS